MFRTVLLAAALFVSLTTNVLAEGFALTEWSARGLSLAGGMVGRADDASALAYNAAGITQLPGTHFMLGASTITPYGALEGDLPGGRHTTDVKVDTWIPPHAYLTHQLNDSFWLGMGIFSRMGLGNSYSGDWYGRYNIYDVGLQTLSFVPTVAYKINDIFSVSAGVEFMYLTMYEGMKVPVVGMGAGGPTMGRDNDLQMQGQSLGIGAHFGLHARFNEQWSVGLAYKSQVTQNFSGDAEFSRQETSLLGMKKQYDCNIKSTVQLPDSIALGIAYKPLENLSFELGGTFTRWSTYNHLNIYFDEPNGYRSLNEKKWRDGWNFNASVEYKPTDWLALRAGYWYETPVVNKKYADYMVPSYGRDVLSLGAGFNWENWTLDVAYAHIWIHELDYSESAQYNSTVSPGKSSGGQTDIFSVSLGYSF